MKPLAMQRSKLAVNGGTPVRRTPMPPRALIGQEERTMALAVLDQAIESGEAFGYDGPFERQYEEAFAEFMGGGFADGVNSGTNALYVALSALQIEPYSEIIVPPITDPGGVMPVPLTGCIPVCADCALGTYNTSVKQIEPLINDHTRAIIVAHIAGDCVDMSPIRHLAQQHGLQLIEDCSQAHGARYEDALVGTMGDIAVFSTMSGKLHCTGAQGGVVYTRDEELHRRVKQSADRGKTLLDGTKQNLVAALNCNLNELSAAIGCAQLRKLPDIIARRRIVAQAIESQLIDCAAVAPHQYVPNTQGTYWFMYLHLDLDAITVSKTEFCQALSAEGIPVVAEYRHIPCLAPWYQQQSVFGTKGFPWNHAAAPSSLTREVNVDNALKNIETHFNILIHENYGAQEIDDIVQAIRKVDSALAE